MKSCLKFKVTEEQKHNIANLTVGQFENSLYILERRNRLTASNFGAVIKRRLSTPCHNLVKIMLYPRNITTPALEFGKTKEAVAISLFEKQMNVKVQSAGLFIDSDCSFLGASPDGKLNSYMYNNFSIINISGLIGDEEIIEVKCLYKLYQQKKSLLEAAQSSINFCLQFIDPSYILVTR